MKRLRVSFGLPPKRLPLSSLLGEQRMRYENNFWYLRVPSEKMGTSCSLLEFFFFFFGGGGVQECPAGGWVPGIATYDLLRGLRVFSAFLV